MSTILVTGGTGYIGSHCCVELLLSGHTVIAVDNLCNSSKGVLNRIETITGKLPLFYQADIRDRAALSAIFAEYSIDAVIHFAGLKAVPESVQKPLLYYNNNLTGTIVLLECMAEAGCKTFVFSSSATVYGMHNPVPFTEDMPTSATNPYGYTKLMIEQFLADLCTADPEWSAVALRYFNPIGAHESGLLGDNPNGIPNNLMPYVAQVSVGRRERLSVYGTDYPTPDGTGVRDYIHVVDLAKGHLNALTYAQTHSGFLPVNLGTGTGISVLELVSAYEKACGKEIPRILTDRRPGDIAASYADASKARELLGWEAEKTVDDMCRDSWNFIRRNPDGIPAEAFEK